MTARSASSAVIAETAKSVNHPIYLYELYLDEVVTYGCNSDRPVTYSGNTYPALCNFISFDSVEESSGLKVSQTSVQLSGVDQTQVAAILSYEYIDRRMVIRRGFMDDCGALMVDPIPILDGRCDAPYLEEDPDGGSLTVTITVGSQWTDFERVSGRHTNHEEQQIHAPGDMFFEFVAGLANKEIKWGRT